jgi:dipeptidase
MLEARKGTITVADMARILRHVGDEASYEVCYEVCYEGVPDKICMHAAPEGERWWQATGAMITEASEDGIIAWMTGTSATDLSIFKPLLFGAEIPDLGPAPLGTYTEGALWWRHEHLHRRAMADYAALKPEIRADFDALEEEFFAEAPPLKKATASQKSAFMAACWRRAEEMTEAWIKKLEQRNYFIQNERYREMWDRFNREAAFPI